MERAQRIDIDVVRAHSQAPGMRLAQDAACSGHGAGGGRCLSGVLVVCGPQMPNAIVEASCMGMQ